VTRYLLSSTNEGNDQRRPRGGVERGGLDAALFRPDIHVPEFAHAEDLMIEPDGTRVPAAEIQEEAAKELMRGQRSPAGRRRTGLGRLGRLFRRSA
jgi:hypothetical protein